MTIPFTLGAAQIVLLILAIVGIALLIHAIMGLRTRRILYEDEQGRQYYRRRRGHFRIGRAVGGVVLALLAVSILWLTALVQTYVGLESEIKVAQVRGSEIDNQNHTMIVEMTTYDQNGKAGSDKFYSIPGDRWVLQGNILRFPGWLNILGVHSGYKLTRISGQYDSIDDENTHPHKAYPLNGGDDDFFKTVYKQAWSSPFVEAAYGNAVIVPADSHTYDVYVSQTGLTAKPEK